MKVAFCVVIMKVNGQQTISGEQFLLAEAGDRNKIIIFSTSENLNSLFVTVNKGSCPVFISRPKSRFAA